MAANESPRRIVAWVDGSAHAPSTVAWAAQHAAARALPLHLLRSSAVAVAAGPRAVSARPGFAERGLGAADIVRLAHDVRRISADHRELRVTFQVLPLASGCPGAAQLDDGDVLVTGPNGFLRLAGDDTLPGPVVIVPERSGPGTGNRKVLLLTGHRFSRALAAFAFSAAADLGAPLDLVRVAPPGRRHLRRRLLDRTGPFGLSGRAAPASGVGTAAHPLPEGHRGLVDSAHRALGDAQIHGPRGPTGRGRRWGGPGGARAVGHRRVPDRLHSREPGHEPGMAMSTLARPLTHVWHERQRSAPIR